MPREVAESCIRGEDVKIRHACAGQFEMVALYIVDQHPMSGRPTMKAGAVCEL